MNLNLERKVFIISGGSSGIGKAITLTLSEEGAIPVIVGRNKESGPALEKAIKERGGNALFIEKLLGKGDDVKSVIDLTVETFGRIDGVINNAGVNDGVGLEKGSPERFRESIRYNLTHYYDLVHYALPYLKESKGNVLNISSKTAITGQGGTSGYAASKGAQLALTREWAVELAPYGIRVNAIIPAEVMTPQYERWIKKMHNPEETLRKITSRIPLGKRMTEPAEIAAMVAFIISEKSNHTTGQWLFVDGGYVHFDRAMLND